MQEKRLDELLTSAAQLYSQGAYAQALTVITHALDLSPSNAKALNVRGLIYLMLGDTAEAVSSIEQAIASDTTQALFHANLCNALLANGERSKAITAGQRAVAIDAANPANLDSLATALVADYQYAEAQNIFARANQLDPTSINSITQGLTCARKIADFSGAKRWIETLVLLFNSPAHLNLRTKPLGDLVNLAYSDVIAPLPPGVFATLTSEIDRRLASLSSTSRLHSPRSGYPIKIGYLSERFGDHPIGHVIHEIFKLHNRTRFEVHVFSLEKHDDDPGPYAQSIREGCDHFHDLSQTSPRSAAHAIQQAELDVLLYLDGFMSPSAPLIVAQRPAPRIYFWLGHAGELRLSCIDATIADGEVLPSEEADTYGTILRTANCYHCASPQAASEYRDAGLQSHLDSLGKEPQPHPPFVFCAFNNPEKIDSDVFEAWMQILRATPRSLLWLSNQFNVPALEQNLRSAARHHGIGGERLVFAGRLRSKQEHLGRHKQADLFLDTFTHTASTTALDALWMGLPIITLRGDRFASRICADFLTRLEIPELICSSKSEYVQTAIALANNRATLTTLKERLVANVSTSSLFDPLRFIRSFEDAICKETR
jgi:protein O-GlcNAc transferase